MQIEDLSDAAAAAAVHARLDGQYALALDSDATILGDVRTRLLTNVAIRPTSWPICGSSPV